MPRPSTLPEPWLSLAASYGGVEKLAEACGVRRQAIYRWAKWGRKPGAITRTAINGMARRRKIAEPWP
jgi:hypothetical protein